MNDKFIKVLAIESWIWYGICIIVVMLRYSAQYIHKGSVGLFTIDDWLMILCVCTYTIVVVGVNKLVTTQFIFDDPTTPAAKKASHTFGMLVLLCETASLTQLWGVKACLLLLYGRLARRTVQMRIVKMVAVYCALGYVACILALYVEFCHPFPQFFVPYSTNEQCVTWLYYYITQLVFNVSSDFMILAIPVSVVWSSTLPLNKKISLCGMFSLGLFIIAAACMNKYYDMSNWTADAIDQWYIREASVAIIVGNLVLCKPVFIKAVEKSQSMISILTGQGGGSSSRSEASRPSTNESRSGGSMAKNSTTTMSEVTGSESNV